MILTELYDGQGLGNQLWVYATCRSIAEELQVPFSILGRERFKGSGFLDVEFGETGHRGGESVLHERMFYDPELDYISSAFDGRVLQLRGPTRLEGLYQSERYFFGRIERLQSYLPVNPACLAGTPVADDLCILNIRGGEYKRHKRLVLPKSYWEAAMRNMTTRTGIDRFMIVTDDPRYSRALFPQIDVLQAGIGECYAALYNARQLILSNSSFSYFPAKTGLPKRLVIAPRHWARFGNEQSRWASPANLYEAWEWQDAQGGLHSHADCLDEQRRTQDYYDRHYNVLTAMAAIERSGLRRYIPRPIRAGAKKALSLLFPRHIG